MGSPRKSVHSSWTTLMMETAKFSGTLGTVCLSTGHSIFINSALTASDLQKCTLVLAVSQTHVMIYLHSANRRALLLAQHMANPDPEVPWHPVFSLGSNSLQINAI